MSSQQRMDHAYGRNGGRVVPWSANDPDVPRCHGCSRVLLRAEIAAGLCAECVQPGPDQLDLFA